MHDAEAAARRDGLFDGVFLFFVAGAAIRAIFPMRVAGPAIMGGSCMVRCAYLVNTVPARVGLVKVHPGAELSRLPRTARCARKKRHARFAAGERAIGEHTGEYGLGPSFSSSGKESAMKLLAVNGSPRRGWNTAQLLGQVVKGAAGAGAEVELVHLRDFSYRGCISCFHCKKPKGSSYGRCILKDDLAPVLQRAHEADALVLGSPFYFSVETALMRAFMERLWFQYLLYSAEKPPLSPRKKAVALLYTMNVREEDMAAFGKDKAVAVSKGVMERLFAPCEVFLCCDTKQFADYSKYDTDRWDVPAKLRRHEEVFPKELERAFALGARMVA